MVGRTEDVTPFKIKWLTKNLEPPGSGSFSIKPVPPAFEMEGLLCFSRKGSKQDHKACQPIRITTADRRTGRIVKRLKNTNIYVCFEFHLRMAYETEINQILTSASPTERHLYSNTKLCKQDMQAGQEGIVRGGDCTGGPSAIRSKGYSPVPQLGLSKDQVQARGTSIPFPYNTATSSTYTQCSPRSSNNETNFSKSEISASDRL
ncbi:unnamed protein product [Nesidiocoris tenuis]|uniref:Uncharacterized protein n=1 Tax=Nesidiocoris tenuis TaxID=355587 RepID=A0A6H5GG27_9HEMI|nr:unnamed protein product [Nesidiocoris tenuis]